MSENSELLSRAREYLGKSAVRDTLARDVVNLPMIRRWCEAMGETNPIFTDADAARAHGRDGIVAPPAMLDVWTMAPYRPQGRSADDNMAVLQLFDDAGYTGVVATNVTQEYDRELREGDRIQFKAVVDEVSDEKRTGLGTGHFVTMRYEFSTDQGEPVGRMLFRVLKFKPPEGKAAPAAAEKTEEKPAKWPHPRPAVTHDNAFFWEGIANRKLLFQSCSGCNTLRHPPGPACPHCHSMEWTAVESSGKGTIHSFVVMHQPRLPTLEYPLPVVLVELEEGPRIVANMLDASADDIRVGQAVTLDFWEVEPGYVLPAFRLA